MAQQNMWGYVDMKGVDEASIASTLSSVFGLKPESVVHGTPVTRLVIIGQHGLIRGKEHLGRQSLTLDFASKIAKYMGNGIGPWAKRFALDTGTNNRVVDFYDVNDTWKHIQNRHEMWDANIVWVENYNRKYLFYPALQTAYTDNTSILNNVMVMAAAATLKRVAHRSWTLLSGKALSKEQLITESDKYILTEANKLFHGRFVIEVRTYLTDQDNERGYSWHCDITIKGGTMRTVGKYTIIVDRLD